MFRSAADKSLRKQMFGLQFDLESSLKATESKLASTVSFLKGNLTSMLGLSPWDEAIARSEAQMKAVVNMRTNRANMDLRVEKKERKAESASLRCVTLNPKP